MRVSREKLWAVWTKGVATVWRVNDANTSSSEQGRLDQLLAENIRLKAELRDYRVLKQQLEAPALVDFKAIPAAVAGRPIDTFQSQLIVNRGAGQGVVIGAPVVIQSSTLVGFVTELSESTAVITLLFHPSTTIAAEAINEDIEVPAATGLAEGSNYTAVKLTTVPRDLSLQVGQVVVTRGTPGVVPTGLVIGKIKEVISGETEIYQEATIEVSYDLDELRAVTLLRPITNL